MNDDDRKKNGYLFIDGNCFHMEIKKFHDKYLANSDIDVNWRLLTEEYWKTYYYDSPVGIDADEVSYIWGSDREYINQIYKTSSTHIRTGELRLRKGKNEQKMVDVLLAVDALSMAINKSFTKVTILTGDLDFRPLLSSLVNLGIHVRLFYPERGTNKKLIRAADEVHPIDYEFISSIVKKTAIAGPIPINGYMNIHKPSIFNGKSKNGTLYRVIRKGRGYALILYSDESSFLSENRKFIHDDINVIRDFLRYELEVAI